MLFTKVCILTKKNLLTFYQFYVTECFCSSVTALSNCCQDISLIPLHCLTDRSCVFFLVAVSKEIEHSIL